MIENALTQKGVSVKTKITVKALVSLFIIALAVALPAVAHTLVGAKAGITLLPMYLPVVLGACLLGEGWGVLLALATPSLSFLLTGMPSPERLAFMTAELFVTALVCGAFSKAISKKPMLSFAAVLSAALCGRGSFLALAVIFEEKASFGPQLVLSQIISGIPGILLQLVLVPVSVVLLNKVLKNNE